MGVDARINLEGGVQVRDVATVLGLAAGLKAEEVPYRNGEGTYKKVIGVKVNGSTVPDLPEMATIHLSVPEESGTLVDGERVHFCFYHFENPDGSKSLGVKSTPFWLAVGLKLITFFGGKMLTNDCEAKPKIFRRPKPRPNNAPEDGRPYIKFQKDLFAVTPITKADMDAMRKFAGYPEADVRKD
jgi:hypothetical protein